MDDRDLSSEAVGREHGSVLGNLILLDISKKPDDNSDRLKKIGQYWQTMGAAVVDADQPARRVVVGNGITKKLDGKRTERTIFPFEPDNLLLLFHDQGPTGTTDQNPKLDRVWALRMIADSQHLTGTKPNRSTRITNQDGFQEYGLLSDVVRIVSSGALEFEEDVKVTGAGLLAAMDPRLKGKGFDARGAAAINIARNAYVSDGEQYAPWAHILTWLRRPGSVATPGQDKNPTRIVDTQTAFNPGAIAGGVAPSGKGQLGIHASSGFKYPSGLIVSFPNMEGAPLKVSDTGDAANVHFYPGKPVGNLQDTAHDKLSNQDEIPRNPWPGIAAYVRIPNTYPPSPTPYNPTDSHHSDFSYHGTPTDSHPSSGGGGSIPTLPNGSGSPSPPSSASNGNGGADPSGTKPRDEPNEGSNGPLKRPGAGGYKEYFDDTSGTWRPVEPLESN